VAALAASLDRRGEREGPLAARLDAAVRLAASGAEGSLDGLAAAGGPDELRLAGEAGVHPDTVQAPARAAAKAAADEAEAGRRDVAAALAAVPDDGLVPERLGQDVLRQARATASAASGPRELMACLVAAEAAVRPESLRPWWRLWSHPPPRPSETRTFAAVTLRALAFKAAVGKDAVGSTGAGLGASACVPPSLPVFRFKERLGGAAAVGAGGRIPPIPEDAAYARALVREDANIIRRAGGAAAARMGPVDPRAAALPVVAAPKAGGGSGGPGGGGGPGSAQGLSRSPTPEASSGGTAGGGGGGAGRRASGKRAPASGGGARGGSKKARADVDE
jgi:hypothetical protein